MSCLLVSPLDEINDSRPSGGSTGDSGLPDSTAGGGGSAGSGAGGSCTSHEDCAPDDALGRCVEGKCVTLRTAECPCVPPVPGNAWADDNSILIGAFAPMIDAKEKCAEDSTSRNFRLALEEINKPGIDGLPGPNLTRRPIALLLCDNYGHSDLSYADRQQAVFRGLKHLTEELRVPAVLAQIELSYLKKAFSDYGLANNVFFLAPHGATNELAAMTDEQDKDLLWHMLGVPGDVAETYAALVPALEDPVRAEPDLNAATGPLKVMLISSNDLFDEQLGDAVASQLTAQGIDFERLDLQIETPNLVENATTAILTSKPHIVLSTIGPKLSEIAFEVHAAWRPFYVLSPWHVADLSQLETLIFGWLKQGFNGIDRRYIGVNVAGTEDVSALFAYEQRLHTRFDDGATKLGENFYDAVYFLAYALLGGGGLDSVSGPDVPMGMDRILGQAPDHFVGPDDMGAVFDVLSKPTGSVRLHGISGPPGFNRKSGVRTMTGAVYCFQYGPAEMVFRDHVGHFDPLSKKLRLALQYQNKTPPCLGWLGLPNE